MGRKFVEHPLVVAVAMGLLAPVALPGDDETLRGRSTVQEAIQAVMEDEADLEDEPSAEDFARVEDLWYQVRTNID